MKKLALILAIIMVVASVLSLVACTTDDGKKDDEKKDDVTTTTTTTVRTVDVDPDTGDDDDDDEDPPKEALADASKFTVDGDLSEWADLNKIEIVGDPTDTVYNSGNKKVYFWGALTEEGIYLACDVYYDIYKSGNAQWYQNTNFEIFIDSEAYQYYIYGEALGETAARSTNIDESIMITTELTGEATKYHSVVEAFISNDNIADGANWRNSINIGLAWKTEGDILIGGGLSGTGNTGGDEYWTPHECTWPRSCEMVVTPSGLYAFGDYFED